MISLCKILKTNSAFLSINLLLEISFINMNFFLNTYQDKPDILQAHIEKQLFFA